MKNVIPDDFQKYDTFPDLYSMKVPTYLVSFKT